MQMVLSEQFDPSKKKFLSPPYYIRMQCPCPDLCAPLYEGGYYCLGGSGSGYVSTLTNFTLPYTTKLEATVGYGGQNYESVGGKPSYVVDENGNELIRAEGGKASYWRGGDGYR